MKKMLVALGLAGMAAAGVAGAGVIESWNVPDGAIVDTFGNANGMAMFYNGATPTSNTISHVLSLDSNYTGNYSLSFGVFDYYQGVNSNASLQVHVGNSYLANLSNFGYGAHWYSYVFSANSLNPTLSFTGNGTNLPGNPSPILLSWVDVEKSSSLVTSPTISPVPEPETYALTMVGLGMVLLRLRGKRNGRVVGTSAA